MPHQFVILTTILRRGNVRPTTVTIPHSTLTTTRRTRSTFRIRTFKHYVILRSNKLRHPMANHFNLLTRNNRRVVPRPPTPRPFTSMSTSLNRTPMTPTKISPIRNHPTYRSTVILRCGTTFFSIKNVPHKVKQTINLRNNILNNSTFRVSLKCYQPVFQHRKPSYSLVRAFP